MMATGHGNIKSYLYKYKIIDSSMCPCKTGEQTTDHILYDCELRLDCFGVHNLTSDQWAFCDRDKVEPHSDGDRPW